MPILYVFFSKKPLIRQTSADKLGDFQSAGDAAAAASGNCRFRINGTHITRIGYIVRTVTHESGCCESSAGYCDRSKVFCVKLALLGTLISNDFELNSTARKP